MSYLSGYRDILAELEKLKVNHSLQVTFVHKGFVHISTFIMVEVLLAHLTTVLQRCPEDLSVTVYTLFFIRTSNFAAEAEPKLNVLIFSRFEPKPFFACS